MPFFLTIADQKDDGDDPDHVQVVTGEPQRQQRTQARRRQGRENRQGMNVALIENTKDHIHRQYRREDQPRLVAERFLECLGIALERALQGRRSPEIPACFGYRLRRCTQRETRREVE